MGRIQINALVTFPDSRNFNDSQRQMIERYLNYFKDDAEEAPEDSRPPAIINSIKDWLDSGDDDAITGLSGAESDYYRDLIPSYSSRNGPIADLNDLLLVKGITPELFYGSADKPGIADSLTVHGMKPGAGTEFTFPGKINVNTAELPVLAALLPSENPEVATALYELRQQVAEDKDAPDLSDPSWYKNITGLGDLNLDTKLITTASDTFRIVSVAKVNDSTLTATAVVQRQTDPESGKWTCRILNWYTQ
jgi:general secretion pathway protein K